MFQILCARSAIVLTCVLSSFILVGTVSSSLGGNTENFTQFFGCKKSLNYECDIISNNFKGYSQPGNATEKIPILRTPDYVPGIDGKAVKLQAKNFEAITVGDSPGFNSFNFSVSFWIKTYGVVQPYAYIISHVDRARTAGWFVDMFSNGTGDFVRLSLTDKDGKISSSADVPIEKGVFVNVIGTFDGSTIKVYKNARLVGSSRYEGTYWPYSLTPLTFGSASYGNAQLGWSGIIDEISLYNTTLGSLAINRSNSLKGDKTDLVGNWRFNGNLLDSSQYQNNGEMHTLVTSLSFSPDGKLFYVEKNTGNVKVIPKKKADPILFAHIADSYVSWEQGLLGFTVDPLYKTNHYVYLYYTVNDSISGNAFNRLVRFTDINNKATDEKILLDRIPASNGYHSGGALAFGPDDKLYIVVGDATEHIFAQDPSIVVGKVLRINRDGSIPFDNPYPNSPVYTIGHRNMFGIAFDDGSGNGIVTENGDYYYDEINLIKKGGNYGFPTLQVPNIAPELANNSSIKPIRSYKITIGPTQAIYYDMKKIPEFTGKFLFGTYTGSIYALALNKTDSKVSEEDVTNFRFYPFEPVIAISKSPDGEIYFGGYNIYKLQIPEGLKKLQILYPLKIIESGQNLIHDVYFDEGSHQIRINLTKANSDHTNFMKIEIPKNLINITNIQFGGDNDSVGNQTLDVKNSNLVQYNESKDLNILDITVLPKISRITLSGR